MAVITVSAIIGGIIGIVTWIGSLPPWVTYIVFLAGLGIDVGVIEGTFGNGIVGTFIGQAFGVFGLHVIILSSHVMLLALFIPLMGFFFQAYH